MEIKKIGEGVGFERIRRITGYLVGTLDRFNNAKRSEEADRVKHTIAVDSFGTHLPQADESVRG